jgi:hypothetical protein
MCFSRIWLCAAAIAAAAAVVPARADDIVPDRPGFCEAASVVPRGRFQVEAGSAWTRVDADSSVLDLPEVVLRVGVGASLELRVQASDWLRVRSEGTDSGWSDTAVGLRWQLAAGSHDLSVRGVVYLPIGSGEWTDNKVDPEGAVSWAHELGGGWSTSATVSARRFTSVTTTIFSPSLSVEHSLGPHASTFLEYGANVADGHSPLNLVDHGYTWLPNSDTQVDVSIGLGLSSAAPDFFVSVGFSRRF